MRNKQSIQVIFGGSSGERAISLHSARAVYELLNHENDYDLNLIYTDGTSFFEFDKRYLYSNTAEDFRWLYFNLPIIELKNEFTIPLVH